VSRYAEVFWQALAKRLSLDAGSLGFYNDAVRRCRRMVGNAAADVWPAGSFEKYAAARRAFEGGLNSAFIFPAQRA